MRSTRNFSCALAVLAVLVACSPSKHVQVPARVDLRAYGTVGMINFSSDATDDLGRRASREFLSAIQAAQPGVAVLELGDADALLTGLDSRSLDISTIRRIGDEYGVDVIIFGALDAKEVRPKISIGSVLSSVNARAEIEGSLNAKMFETRNGATVWTRNAAHKETVASLSVSEGGVSSVGADYPDTAQEKLVHVLVAEATEDFWPRWIRQ